jgi:hypothetical protein
MEGIGGGGGGLRFFSISSSWPWLVARRMSNTSPTSARASNEFFRGSSVGSKASTDAGFYSAHLPVNERGELSFPDPDDPNPGGRRRRRRRRS